MFVRIKKSPSGASAIQIVENQRLGKKTKQRVVRHVGTAHDDKEIAQLKQLAHSLKVELELDACTQHTPATAARFAAIAGRLLPQRKSQKINPGDLHEVKRLVLGIHDIYGPLYDRIGFTNLFSRPRQREKAAQLLREIVLARIANPMSKRASVSLLAQHFGVHIDLDKVYRMMDKIDDRFCERIQEAALNKTLTLTGGKLKVLFYDATTLYFESFTEDGLKQNGYSKDMKFNQPQVLLCLFVTEQGLPVGYEVFPGSTFEGHTLIPVLEKLKKRYQLEEVVVVADRGLLSERNLQALEKAKVKYIVGARIKNMTQRLQTLILDRQQYQTVKIPCGAQRHKNRVLAADEQSIAAFDYGQNKKLIVHYSRKRAKKDQHDREEAVEKLCKKLAKSNNPKSLLSNYGYKKYLEIAGETAIHINQAKISQEAQWDGLTGVVTNIKDANPETLLTYYRGLWQIEESFRINKHDLRMRPIFHWKPHRVRAHIAIAFMAFVCVRYLEYLVSVQSQKLSPEIIRQSLLQVQASIIEESSSGRRFLLSSHINEAAKEIYRVVGIRLPNGTKEIQCGA